MEAASKEIVEQLNQLLGSYKAEWIEELIFDTFTEPEYFNELKARRPCVLIGGRGTGKTTVLRGLSYEGQYVFSGRDPRKIAEWNFVGIYYRVNTNRVTAFQGPELSEEQWTKYFAHYLNLIFCKALTGFAIWVERQTSEGITLSGQDYKRLCLSLHIPECGSIANLAEGIAQSLTEFEAQINNVADEKSTSLSMQGAPIDILVDALGHAQLLRGKQFFFLIDEFENLLGYQQRVLNTLIKHAQKGYTFKVGVRELGWRERSALNKNEQLTHPADYVKLDVREVLDRERFRSFAERVLEGRLQRLRKSGMYLDRNLKEFFPGLSEEEELLRLIDDAYIKGIRDQARRQLSESDFASFLGLSVPWQYFLSFWAPSEFHGDIGAAFLDMQKNIAKWKDRYGNYFYSSLFAARSGKRGLRKYYAGWETFLSLADGNIRYLMALVHASVLRHLQEHKSLDSPIAQEVQTFAAQEVGRTNLSELEGLSVEGARLTKLLLGLGRVFQVMAADPAGHTPEVNQFHVPPSETDTPDEAARVKELLDLAVMHLALVRSSGNKLTDETETREYDYMVHPIYSAFFVFGHRRKRKTPLSAQHLLGLVQNTRQTIRSVLAKSNRSDDENLPDQLGLFQNFYVGH